MYVQYNVNVMSTIAMLCCLGNNIILRTEREMETGPSHLLVLSLSLWLALPLLTPLMPAFVLKSLTLSYPTIPRVSVIIIEQRCHPIHT